MAQIITRQNKRNMTAGEREFFECLQQYLDDDYLVWYNLPTQGTQRRYPDFLIFHPQHGLLCIEVKDWGMKQLRRVSPDWVTLERDGQNINFQNPLEQARACFLPLINRMEQDPLLQQQEGRYAGHLAMPWGVGVVMSRWYREKIKPEKRGLLEASFPAQQTLYREDISADSLDKATFIRKLHGMFPYAFAKGLNPTQTQRVRAYIFPEIIINSPQMAIFNDIDDDEEERAAPEPLPEVIQVMDLEQERTARALGEGHRIIHGVAGAGKTLLVEFRARQLAESIPQGREILIICFNKTLAARYRQRLANLSGVVILHFHKWCTLMKDKYQLKVPYGDNYVDELPLRVAEAFQKEKIPPQNYYAVLIDEGHDLRPEWLEMLALQTDEDKRLLFVYDGMQGIYRNEKLALKDLGIEAVGRSQILRINYRNSQEIAHHAVDFVTPFIAQDDEELLRPTCGGVHRNITPVFQLLDSFNAEMLYCAELIERWVEDGCPFGDIAILCGAKWQGGKMYDFLQANNLPVQNLILDERREDFALNPHEITLSTLHSSKGLEFTRVIIVGVGYLRDDEDNLAQSARLLYVGMTRAMQHLHLTACKKNRFTAVLTTKNAT